MTGPKNGLFTGRVHIRVFPIRVGKGNGRLNNEL